MLLHLLSSAITRAHTEAVWVGAGCDAQAIVKLLRRPLEQMVCPAITLPWQESHCAEEWSAVGGGADQTGLYPQIRPGCGID